MKDCIFCNIIEGNIPSKKIYEDEVVLVIMNINPEANGDLLVITKKHYQNILELDELALTHINNIIKEMAELLTKKLNATGITFSTNTGTNQEIKHMHYHVTPGYETEQPIVDLDIIYDKLK